MDGRDAEPITFLGRPLSPSFAATVVTIAPGTARPYDELEWRDALVVVECGQVALECRAGGRRRFGPGSILHLTGLGIEYMHNEDAEESVVLVAVTRKQPDAPGPLG
jgi:hypothetical protein